MGDAGWLSGDSCLGGRGRWLAQMGVQGPASAARHWEDTAPLYSLHSQSPWSWHADLEGHTLPTWYKGTGMHPSVFFPFTTTPLFGVEHHCVSIPVDIVDHRHVDDLKDFKQWGHAFQSGFIYVNWMDKLQDEYGELRADAGLNIFNEDWPAETRAGDSDTRRTMTPLVGGAMYSFAREVLIPHLETRPVVNVTTFIVVKAGLSIRLYTASIRPYTCPPILSIRPYTARYTAVYSEVYGRILIVFVANFDIFCLVLC